MKLQLEIKLERTEYYDRKPSKKGIKTEGMGKKQNENNGTKRILLKKPRKSNGSIDDPTEDKDNTIDKWKTNETKHLNTDKTSQVRQWFWWPVERWRYNWSLETGFQNLYTTEMWKMPFKKIHGNWLQNNYF